MVKLLPEKISCETVGAHSILQPIDQVLPASIYKIDAIRNIKNLLASECRKSLKKVNTPEVLGKAMKIL